jgi:ATP-binding protein involved in chromosome partitioning
MEISQKSVEKTLSKLMHPEINYSLVDLGMIKDVAFEQNKVKVTLKVPFLDVPIRDHLIQMIKESVSDLNEVVESEVNLQQMSQQERDEFMKKAKKGWKL